MFYDGKPCKHGHGVKRYISTRCCVQCAKNSNSTWATANYTKLREKSKAKWDLRKSLYIEGKHRMQARDRRVKAAVAAIVAMRAAPSAA